MGGLKEDVLKNAEAGLSDSDSKSMVSGAKNSGFGLHLIHQLAKTLDSKIYLSKLDNVHKLLNTDMVDAIKEYQKIEDNSKKEGAKLKSLGPGTLLYITIPVCEDSVGAQKALSSALTKDSDETGMKSIKDMKCVFSPKPAPDSANSSFRILVADDVFMLRKGMVNILTNIFSSFPDCPLTIYTACTAEDMLRITSSQPLDLIVSDNQFAIPTDAKQISHEGDTVQGRPHVFLCQG